MHYEEIIYESLVTRLLSTTNNYPVLIYSEEKITWLNLELNKLYSWILLRASLYSSTTNEILWSLISKTTLPLFVFA